MPKAYPENGNKNNLNLMRIYPRGCRMETQQLAEIIRSRLNLEDHEWSVVENNPKFQKLFKNAIKASQYRLVAEVIE
jgi:hypothetical protein